MRYYISFGQAHAHSVGGVTYDKDSIAIIEADSEEEARIEAFNAFGNKWSMLYKTTPNMEHFPRGFIYLN